MNPHRMSHKAHELVWAWITTGTGVTVSVVSFQHWFADWNPVLQGVVLILTAISILISLWKSSATKTK
jgi:hypothetical protein